MDPLALKHVPELLPDLLIEGGERLNPLAEFRVHRRFYVGVVALAPRSGHHDQEAEIDVFLNLTSELGVLQPDTMELNVRRCLKAQIVCLV